ncbi:hypothetical protein HD592_001684 [Schaalia hyovaginalis]|uniref:Uncharacterized protein n=1 Tax=Schaalia hyovaginalis TaxID=29316 RepID=A0A923IZU1_9ACTO|nr:hypothetical protein [Schaalia hyovaginalis]
MKEHEALYSYSPHSRAIVTQADCPDVTTGNAGTHGKAGKSGNAGASATKRCTNVSARPMNARNPEVVSSNLAPATRKSP